MDEIVSISSLDQMLPKRPANQILPIRPEQGIISDELQHYLSLYFVGVWCSLVSLVGYVTNIINIVVFIRQGLQDSTTISLFSLSISDLGANICTFFLGIGIFLVIKEMNILVEVRMTHQTIPESYILFDIARIVNITIVDWQDLTYVACSWPRAMFIDISMLTTVFISTERCLCVILPFKVKGLITVSRAAKILITIYLFQFSCYMPVFVTNGLSWQPTMMYTMNHSTSNLRLDIWFAPGRVQIETVSNIFNSISIPTISFITVVTCTYILIRALRRSAHFRSRAAASHTSTGEIYQRNALKEKNLESGRETLPAAGLETYESKDKGYILSSKDRKVGKLVTLVAVVFILCSTPQLMVVYGRRFLPDLDVNGRYENFMWTAFGTGFIIGGINACINMFIYLNSSSRYKTVFNEIFCRGDT